MYGNPQNALVPVPKKETFWNKQYVIPKKDIQALMVLGGVLFFFTYLEHGKGYR